MKNSFFNTVLESFFLTRPTLHSLDIRGNGLSKEDGLYLLGLLERNTALRVLNFIPVMVDDARQTETEGGRCQTTDTHIYTHTENSTHTHTHTHNILLLLLLLYI
eukprot:GHVR01055644.1.p1 GENE.GHVR01055644.1~~GHVR01055644.1.p1  ORF type:complete len:105 (+),score=43.47 GHVR01055644.1:199-513(+)